MKTNYFFLILPVMVFVFCIAGCGENGKETDDKDKTGDDASKGDDDDNDDNDDNDDDNGNGKLEQPAACGIKEYEWLPPEEMGAVIEFKEMKQFSMSKDAIAGLLEENGYGGILDIKYGAKVYLVRYETQDRGKKVEATTVVGWPRLTSRESLSAPTVLWLHGTSGFMDDCAPSRKGADGALPVVMMASQGYVAAAPDYLGMNGFGEPSTMFHPYLVAEATAIASLDSVRAAEKFIASEATEAIETDGNVIFWGGSQGGHAAFACDLFAPYYAPEYNYPAAIAMIPPSNLVAQSEAAVSEYGPAAITLAGALTAISRWYGHHDKITEVLKNEEPQRIAELLVELMDGTCGVDEKEYDINEVSDIYTDDFVTTLKEGKFSTLDPWYCLMSENSFTHTSVKRESETPFLFILSENDELVNTPIEREAFDTLCEKGYEMDYLECKGARHTQGAVWSLKDQFEWAADRLAGKPLNASCVRKEPECCRLTDKGPCIEEE